MRIGLTAMFNVDSLTRHAHSLQQSDHAAVAQAVINRADAERLGLNAQQSVVVMQAEVAREMPLEISDAIPVGSVWIAAGVDGSEGLGAMIGPIDIRAAEGPA